MTLPHYTSSGQKQTAYSVPADVFSRPQTNHNLIKAAYEHYLSKKRVNLAKVKTRAAVRGGGRKPWKQKGLGRARVGTIRSPLWRGGGVVFGPSGQENYAKKLNKKAKVLALKQALTLKKEQAISLKSLPTDGKTATMHSLIFKSLKLNRKVLIVDSKADQPVRLSVRNLKDVALIDVAYLNVFRVMNADWLIFTAAALESLQERFSSSDSEIIGEALS